LIVIDDRLLLEVVVEAPSPTIRPYLEAADRRELYTTGYWYWRLARAIAHPTGGTLSGPFSGMADDVQRRVLGAMADLPASIGVLPLRRLVPIMAALPGQINVLTAEAVAAAIVIDGSIAVTTQSEMLNRTARAAGIAVDVVRPAR
jgi:hypothetical protein